MQLVTRRHELQCQWQIRQQLVASRHELLFVGRVHFAEWSERGHAKDFGDH